MPAESNHDQICANVARLLREERERRKLSLNSVAQQAGLSRQTVTFIETEERNPTLMSLLRITAVLGVNLEDLLAKARAERSLRKKFPTG